MRISIWVTYVDIEIKIGRSTGQVVPSIAVIGRRDDVLGGGLAGALDGEEVHLVDDRPPLTGSRPLHPRRLRRRRRRVPASDEVEGELDSGGSRGGHVDRGGVVNAVVIHGCRGKQPELAVMVVFGEGVDDSGRVVVEEEADWI